MDNEIAEKILNKKTIKERDSKALAATIVVYRTLGYCKEEAILSMQELVHRKNNGDDFDYEHYIKEKIKEIPETTVGEKQLEAFKATLKNVKSGTF